MTKSEYMDALRERLHQYNRALELEILEDYEQHFAEGLAQGRREEDIIAELGNIDDMLKEFSEEDLKQELEIVESQANQSNSYNQLYREVVIDGLLADVEVTASEDDQIRIDYDNCGSKAQKMRFQFYQYEQDGVFYAGVRERTGAEQRGDREWGEGFCRDFDSQFDAESIFNIFARFSQFSSSHGGDIHLNIQIPAGIPAVKIANTSGELWVRGIETQELVTQCTSGDLRIEDVTSKKLYGRTQSGDVEISNIAMAVNENTEIEMQTTSGDLETRDLSAARVRLQTTSGDVSAERLKAGQLKVQTASGEQDLEDIVCDKADLRTGSGDIEATGIQGDELTAMAGSGEVELQADMGAFNVKTGSGDIDMEVSARAREIRITAGSGDVCLDMSRIQGASIVSRTGSGDMNIRGYEVSGRSYNIAYNDGACQVNIITGSGDINVE